MNTSKTIAVSKNEDSHPFLCIELLQILERNQENWKHPFKMFWESF